MTDQKPTGVFVRLPLSAVDIRKMDQAMSQSLKANTQPTQESASEAALLAIGTPMQDAELEIAARDAEIVRLREALVVARNAITSDLNAKGIVCTVWAGPAETLVDYIDAALKGGAA